MKEQKGSYEIELREYEKAHAVYMNTSIFDPLNVRVRVAMRLEAARTAYVLAVHRCAKWRTL